jgi:hypothetical protein
MTDDIRRYEDPSDPLNGPEYHTGKACIEPGCKRQAGTAWSPYWCQPCNAERMNRISQSLNGMLKEMNERTAP